jgi:hypothetical protein
MTFEFLDDREFLEFNVRASFEPDLRLDTGPDELTLYALASQSRQGDGKAAADLAETMQWTLGPGAFEQFRWTHGPRPVENRDWFYSKLFQFFCVLLHDSIMLGRGPYGNRGEGPSVEPDALEQAFRPDDHASCNWHEIVDVAATATSSDDRFDKLQKLVEHRARQRARSIWQRDEIILRGLAAGKSRFEICQMLDAHGVPTTANMKKHGLDVWTAAWRDPEFRPNIYSLFWHVQSRKGVNRPAVARS